MPEPPRRPLRSVNRRGLFGRGRYEFTAADAMEPAADINHPRLLVGQWRLQADRLAEIVAARGSFIDGKPADIPTGVLAGRRYALEDCARELENRLRWSGMLDP